jgi:hypothetical protein
MNILSRFLVILTLLVVSWGWLGYQNPESADLSNLTSPSSPVAIANAPSNTANDRLVTVIRPKLDWNTRSQGVQTYPGMYQAQVALIMNNAPVTKAEDLLNVSAMMGSWGMMPRWNMMMSHWHIMMMSRWHIMMSHWRMMMSHWGGMMPHRAMMSP